MNVSIKNGVLTITIPVNKDPLPESKSKKSLVVASTNGNVVTKELVNGKPLVIGLNAYVKV